MIRIIRTVLVFAVLSLVTVYSLPQPVLAAGTCGDVANTTPDSSPLKDGDVLSLPKVGCMGTAGGDPVLAAVLKLIWGTMAGLSLIFIAIGAFKYTASGGSGDAIASAKKTILYAVLGLILGLSAFTITSIVIGGVS